MKQVPHLILDGAVLAATSIRATRVVVYVTPTAAEPMSIAINERARGGLDPCPIEMVVAPERFLAGQESAVVNTVGGRRPGVPSFVELRSVRQSGVDGRPTLVQNVESLAHASLIARFGADWFREVGTDTFPGTALLTVSGRWAEPTIVEAPLGVRLGAVLSLDAPVVDSIQGVLLGGYGGGWISTAKACAMPLTEEAARAQGSSIGPGVVVLLPSGVCPLLEVSRVVTYMAGESAGQCGPCVHGLAALSRTMEQLAVQPNSLRGGLAALPTLCGLIEGRGACRHPDGVTRFVRTALSVFESHAALHLQRGPCHTTTPPFLFVPPSRLTHR
jgi:NADH:ubiquinone oxidoreductase subunit F (NADH-binding)